MTVFGGCMNHSIAAELYYKRFPHPHLVFSGLCVIIIFFSALASILRAWLDQCPEDFQEPPSYPSLHRVLGFLQKAMPGSEPMRRAQSLLEQLRVQASLENETEGKSYPVTVNNCI